MAWAALRAIREAVEKMAPPGSAPNAEYLTWSQRISKRCRSRGAREAAAALLEVTKGSKAVVLEFEEPVGILEWLASRCPLRVQRRHKFSVGRADGTAVRVRDGREAD